MKCRRCAGPMFPDEEGERFCLMCGERTYDWLGGFLDRLLDAMERQALKESQRLGDTATRRGDDTEKRAPSALRRVPASPCPRVVPDVPVSPCPRVVPDWE